jgi:hypothetical protein
MSSMFKIRCPHCGNESSDSAGGFGLMLPSQQVMRCKNVACAKPFEILPNSYDWWNTHQANGNEDEETEPHAPTKEVNPELLKILTEMESAAADKRPYPEKDEPIYVKRNGEFVEARR